MPISLLNGNQNCPFKVSMFDFIPGNFSEKPVAEVDKCVNAPILNIP